MSYLLKQAGPYTLTKTWYVDGTATDVGTVTIGVTDANGDTVVAAGTATTNNADGTYTYSLADQTQCNILFVTWTRSDTGADLVDRIEVIGSLLFTEAEARAFDNALGQSQANYTDADIADWHMRIANDLEQWTGQSFIERYARIKTAGTGRYHLLLADGQPLASDGSQAGGPGYAFRPRSIIRANDGSDITTTNIEAYVDGRLQRTDAVWTVSSSSTPRNVTVEYTYGHTYQVDNVNRIALLLLRDRLVPQPTDYGGRATSFTGDMGTWRFETPGMRGNVSTIPEVNAWVKRHRVKVPFV